MAEPTFRRIACQLDGGVLVVTLLDAHVEGIDAVEELRKELLDAAALFPAKKWAVDFRSVTFFSSAGIRPLMTLHRKIQGTSGRMVFCNLKRELLDMFLVTRLINPSPAATAPFEQAGDLEDALAKLRHHTKKLVGDVLVFRFTDENLHGEALADELTAELEAAVAASQVTKVVLDFQAVQSVTTPCLRPMLHLRGQLRTRGGSVVLTNLTLLVKEVLLITRLIAPNAATPGLFECCPDTQTALAAFGEKQTNKSS
jgi:anti-anti-sigma factor